MSFRLGAPAIWWYFIRVNPLAPIERFFRYLTNIPNALFSVLGGLFLVGGLVGAAAITSKDLAVAVAVAGTFIGTTLLSMFVPKALYTVKQRELQKAAEDSKAKQKLIDEQRKHVETARRLADAEREITRLEGMRINLDAFRSVMKLGLLEVDMSVTDVVKHRLGTADPTMLRKERHEVYVGALKIPIRAQLGINMGEVRLREDASGRLIVSNIVPSHVIDTCAGAEWQLDEVRTEYIKDGRVVEIHGHANDPRNKEQSRIHENQIRDRLKRGEDFKCFEVGVIKAAEQALRTFLTPLGKEIVFSVAPSTDGVDIIRFLNNHNEVIQRRIEQERNALKDGQRQIDSGSAAS
jgi:hypothetical protein